MPVKWPADWRYGPERTLYTKAITDLSAPPYLSKAPRMRLAGKPFFLSEWDIPWPSPFRAESPIFYARSRVGPARLSTPMHIAPV